MNLHFNEDRGSEWTNQGRSSMFLPLIVPNLSFSLAEKGAEGCKDLMEAFAACVKSAAEGTS